MAAKRTVVLEHDRIQRKLDRMALQLLERNVDEKQLILVGIVLQGAALAKRLKKLLDASGLVKTEILD